MTNSRAAEYTREHPGRVTAFAVLVAATFAAVWLIMTAANNPPTTPPPNPATPPTTVTPTPQPSASQAVTDLRTQWTQREATARAWIQAAGSYTTEETQTAFMQRLRPLELLAPGTADTAYPTLPRTPPVGCPRAGCQVRVTGIETGPAELSEDQSTATGQWRVTSSVYSLTGTKITDLTPAVWMIAFYMGEGADDRPAGSQVTTQSTFVAD